MTGPRKLNVDRMRKRVQVPAPLPAEAHEDPEPILITDLCGQVIRTIYPPSED